MSVNAEDFKVGDAKYEVLPDGTVCLKEWKKATGNVVIPEKVANPKSNKEYTVTAIDKGAFKKAAITTATLPSTVTSIGREAFAECGSLETVHLPQGLEKIPEKCFYRCDKLANIDVDLGSLRSVGAYATTMCKTTIVPKQFFISGSDVTTVYGCEPQNSRIVPYLFLYPDADVKKATSLAKHYEDVILIFADRLATQQIFDFIKENLKTYSESDPQHEEFYFTTDVRNLRAWEDYDAAKNPTWDITHSPWMRLEGKQRWVPTPNYSVYIGVKEDENGGLSLIQEQPYTLTQAGFRAFENEEKIKFLIKLEEFVRVAMEKPEGLPSCYREITPEERVKYDNEVMSAINMLCDSVYLCKPQLNKYELTNVEGFINNQLMSIGADYGLANLNLERWAKNDILGKDLKSGDHKADYERILMLCDKYFTFVDKKSDLYHQAMQLAALCGTERWKEAAAYFPKVHRVVTDNGNYAVPSELSYMQNAINAHGYKAVAPTYARKSSSKGGSNNGSLIDFFTEKAINAAVNHYQRKREEKKARQMFYESIGLDKKGRPRK